MSFAKDYSKTTGNRRSYLDNLNSHSKELGRDPAIGLFYKGLRRRQRSWQHCQQLRNFLQVAGGLGSDATAEAVLRRRVLESNETLGTRPQNISRQLQRIRNRRAPDLHLRSITSIVSEIAHDRIRNFRQPAELLLVKPHIPEILQPVPEILQPDGGQRSSVRSRNNWG